MNNTIGDKELEESKKVNELLYKHSLEIAEKNKALSILSKNLKESNENLQNLLQQRENFMHLLTHKIKGSLNHAKIIFSEMLENSFGPITKDLQYIAEKGLGSAKLGINTIDLMLNTTSLQSGVVQYNFQSIDFRKIILKVIEIKTVSANAKGLMIESLIPENETNDFNIIGDEFWLTEVIQNLVDNAIKYTGVGKITIGLNRIDNKIRFFIKDAGVGITEEDKKRLFTEGGRGKNALRINTESTGYGLYSAKLILDGHRGKIWAESEGENKGSTFWIELGAANAT